MLNAFAAAGSLHARALQAIRTAFEVLMLQSSSIRTWAAQEGESEAPASRCCECFFGGAPVLRDRGGSVRCVDRVEVSFNFCSCVASGRVFARRAGKFAKVLRRSIDPAPSQAHCMRL